MHMFRNLLIAFGIWLTSLSLAPEPLAYDQCAPRVNSCLTACCDGPPKYICPDGLVGYPGIPGLCVPPYRAPGCPDGFAAVPLPSCPPGYYRDPNDTRFCLPDPYFGDLQDCPWGTHPEWTDRGRACVLNYLGDCGPDMMRLQNGICAPRGIWPGSYYWVCLPACPEGTYRDYRRPFSCSPPRDYCPDDYVLEDGRCLPECDRYALRDSYGNCVPPQECPPGYEPNYRGSCVPNNDYCPGGNPPWLDERGNPRCDYPDNPPYDPGPNPEPNNEPQDEPDPIPETTPDTTPETEPTPPPREPPIQIQCPEGYNWVQAPNGQWLCDRVPVVKPKPPSNPPVEIIPPPKKPKDPPTTKGETTPTPIPIPIPTPGITTKLPKCKPGYVLVNGRCQLLIIKPKLPAPTLTPKQPSPPIIMVPKSNLQ